MRQRPAARRAAATAARTSLRTRLPGGTARGSYVQACPTQGSARWLSATGVILSSDRHSGSSTGPYALASSRSATIMRCTPTEGPSSAR